MARWAKPLTIIATTLALSGSPAVLSVCLALCLHDMPAPMAPHHAEGQAAPAAAAPHHGHHASTDLPTAPAIDAAPAARDEAATRLTARGGNCCSDAQLAFMAGPRVERTDVVSLAVASAAAPPSWLQPLIAGHVGLSAGPPVSPPPPFSAPLPLRI